MTDYLALLLEEQREEEQDRGSTGGWETGPVRIPRPRPEEQTEETQRPAGAERSARPGLRPAWPAGGTEEDDAGAGRPAGPDWTTRPWAAGELQTVQAGLRAERPDTGEERDAPGETARTSRGPAGTDAGPWEDAWGGAGSPAGAGAGWLDRAVRASLAGLPQPEQEPRVVTLEPADQSARRLELRQLDRLVRRDARRFDGGFQLL